MRWAAILLTVFCATVAAASAAYDDEPSGLVPSAATLAKVRAVYDRANGHEHGRNLTILEDWRLFQDGTVGSYKVNRWGRDERETTQLGPLTYVKGVLHGVHWEQNRNGIVYSYSGIHELHDAVSEHALRDPADDRNVHLLGESIPLNAYVVEVNPPTGRHTWYYIDKRTGYVARKDVILRRRRYMTTYDDYRIVDGVPEPSRVRTIDSLGNEREQILVNRTLDETPDASDLEMPADRRLLEFPLASLHPGPVRLPVRFVNGLAVVRVVVENGVYDFLLDSGAAGIVIDPSVVQQQQLESYGRRVGATLGSFPETTTIVPQMTIGPLRMHNVVTRVVGMPFRPDDHTRIAGLLGFDFFADSVVHVDVAHGTVEVSSPDHFRAPLDTTGIPVALDDKTPAIRLRAGTSSARAVLDTGANRSIFQAGYADRADFNSLHDATLSRVRGVGGFVSVETARVPLIEFAGVATHEATVDVTSADFGSDDLDGVLGTDLLHAYDLWFDYKTNAVYVRRMVPSPPQTRTALHHR